MSLAIDTLEAFLASLTPTQREFFFLREDEHERRISFAFGSCTRTLSALNELQSEAVLERLARPD